MPIFVVEIWDVDLRVRCWRRVAEYRVRADAINDACTQPYHARVREEWQVCTGPVVK